MIVACAADSRWHAGTMDDRVSARVTGHGGEPMEPLAEEAGPEFMPATQARHTSSSVDSVAARARLCWRTCGMPSGRTAKVGRCHQQPEAV